MDNVIVFLFVPAIANCQIQAIKKSNDKTNDTALNNDYNEQTICVASNSQIVFVFYNVNFIQ